jgi:hypothetical protein
MSGEVPQQASGATGNWQFKLGDTAGSDAAQQAAVQEDAKVSQDPGLPAQQTMPHSDDSLPGDVRAQTPAISSSESVSWSASEFIAHHKSFGWYGALILVTAVAATAVLFVTKDKISTSVIVIVAIILGISAARKPRTLGYRVDGSGLTIGQKFYGYDQFRSFAVVDEDAFASIVLTPLRRFMPLLTIYYDPKDEQEILKVLSGRLPVETHRLDMIDQFMRRIRF